MTASPARPTGPTSGSTCRPTPSGDGFAGWFDLSLDLALTGHEAVWAVRTLSDGALVGSTRYLAIERQHRRLEIGHTW